MGKGENVVTSIFSFSAQCFQKGFIPLDCLARGVNPFLDDKKLKPVQFESICGRHFNCSSNDDL